MCKLLAARLGSDNFAYWVECELNGYPDTNSLPTYRIVSVDSYGTFIGPFTRADRLQIPISILPEKLRDAYRHAYMLNGVSAYISLVQGEQTGCALEQWPMELAVHNASKAVIDMQCISAWKEIPIGAVVRLLDSVKTRILGFAIDLERESPDAGDSPIGRNPVSQEKLTQIFNTNIAGSVSNLANGGSSFSQVSNMAVAHGDWNSLKSYLLSLGLTDSDYEGLRAELETAREAGRLQQEVIESVSSSWIGKLASRAAQGASGVGIEVAAAGVAKAIAAYLGFPA